MVIVSVLIYNGIIDNKLLNQIYRWLELKQGEILWQKL